METTPQEASATFNPFAENSWTPEAPAAAPAGENTRQPETPATTETVVTPTVETTTPAATEAAAPAFDINNYWKEKFEWESEEVAKQKIEELKTSAKQKEFANDYSRQMYDYLLEGKEDDLYNHLAQKKQIEKLLSSEITNEAVAAELVKFGIQNKNKSLTPDEVDFLFDKKFSLPKEPVQTEVETDDEFSVRKAEWAAQVNSIKKEMIIEAKLAQPEIEKLKSELVLPKIGGEATPQLSQEDLQKLEENRTRFIQKVDADYKNFNGFEARYKDGEVEIPVSFSYDDSQKAALKEELKTFDVDGFINERWFSNGEPNVIKIMEDISLLRDKEVILQKVANEVGSQVLKHYRKVTSNVNVTGGQPSNTMTTTQQAANPFAEASWSDRPVAVN